MLIDSSFFVGEINIPNTNKPEVQAELNHFIAKYESELLNHLLGNELYASYLADVDGEQRFQDLINGVSYNDGIDYWRGLIYSYNGGLTMHSMIAYYTYWFWMKDKSSWNSGIGVVRPEGDKAKPISPALKMTAAWNTFSEQVGEFLQFMNASVDVYPEWQPIYMYQFEKINDFDI